MSSFFNHTPGLEPSQDWTFLVYLSLSHLTQSGTTAQRPTGQLWTGRPYFDTTLGYPVWYNGTVWVDAQGNPA